MPLSGDLAELQRLCASGALTPEQFQLAKQRLLKKAGIKSKVDPALVESTATKPAPTPPAPAPAPRKLSPEETEAARLRQKEKRREDAVAEAKRVAATHFADDPAERGAALRLLHEFSCAVEPVPTLGRCRSCELGASPDGLFLAAANSGRKAQGRAADCVAAARLAQQELEALEISRWDLEQELLEQDQLIEVAQTKTGVMERSLRQLHAELQQAQQQERELDAALAKQTKRLRQYAAHATKTAAATTTLRSESAAQMQAWEGQSQVDLERELTNSLSELNQLSARVGALQSAQAKAKHAKAQRQEELALGTVTPHHNS